MIPGTLVQLEWHLTQDGADIFRALLQPNGCHRKQYGFLERPNLPPHIEELSYKIFVYGKAGIGKTSTIARLAGLATDLTYYETTGISVTAVYWPVRLIQTSKVVLFRLEFWEAGDMARKKFDHVLSSCKEEMAAMMFLFSFTDKKSLDAIPEQMSELFQMNERPCPLVVGTRYDLHAALDVSSRDIREFEEQWKIPVIKMKNVLSNSWNSAFEKAEFGDVSLALNIICEQLWNYDQKC